MVYILLAPGFEEAEALVPADLLRRAGVETALVGVTGVFIPGGHGITVKADCAMSQVKLDRAEMIVLPGGGMGVHNLESEYPVEKLVRQAAAQEIWVAAICAAPTLLGKWGLLEGREAVCYPGLEDKLAGARLRMDLSAVKDGKIITGRAAGSAFDFGLLLVEVLAGRDKAQEVRRSAVYQGLSETE